VKVEVEVEEKTEAEAVDRSGERSGTRAGVSSGYRSGMVGLGRRTPGTGGQSPVASLLSWQMRSGAAARLRPLPLAMQKNAPQAHPYSPGDRPLDSDFASDASSRSQKRVSWHLTERERAVRVCRQAPMTNHAPIAGRMGLWRNPTC